MCSMVCSCVERRWWDDLMSIGFIIIHPEVSAVTPPEEREDVI